VARGGPVASTDDWFRRLGEPLTAADRAAADGYAQSLGLDAPESRLAADAAVAEALIRDPEWDSGWWAREERERQALMREAQANLGVEAVLDALSVAVEPHTEPSYRRATEAPALADAGEALARAASGALLLAVHCRALARLCGRGDSHLFMRKYELFARGRWPLGVRDGTLILF
jgi:hypothetical protein